MTTLREKTGEILALARDLHNRAELGEKSYKEIRQRALRLKIKLQKVAAAARAGEMRLCEHEADIRFHTYWEVREGVRVRLQQHDCWKCGKRSVKVKVDTDQPGETLEETV